MGEQSVEPEALDLAFSAVDGSPRVMLRALESVREFGPINMSNVRSALRLDFDELLVAYVKQANRAADRLAPY